MTREAKLGLFVLIGLLSLVISVLLLGDFQFTRHYYLHVLFDNVAGLPDKAKVKIAGVDVGAVKEVTLVDGKAKVTIWLRDGIRLHTDAEASIVSTGIIGSKYLQLTAGSPSLPFLKDGDTIKGIDPLSLDKVVQDVMKKLDSVFSAFEGPEVKDTMKNLSATMSNLKSITETLRLALIDQENRLRDTVANIHSFSKDMAEISARNKDNINEALSDIKSVAARLDRVLAKVEKGEGTVGKLLSDEEMGNNLKETFSDLKSTVKEADRIVRRINLIETKWDYTFRYDTKNEYAHNDVGLAIYPRPDKLYFVGVSNLGDKDSDPGDPEEKNTINFLIGKGYGPLWGYAGVIRSKGGVGVRVKPFWKWKPMNRLEIVAEGYDISRKTPVAKAKVNVGGRVKLTKWANVGAQVEDVYYASNMTAAVNVSFRDDDIGYILGLVGLARP